MKTQENKDVKDNGNKMKTADQPEKKTAGEINTSDPTQLEKANDQEKTLYEEIKHYSKEINKTVKALLKRKEEMEQAKKYKQKAQKELKKAEKKMNKRREVFHLAQETLKEKEREYNEILRKIESQKKVLEQLQEA